MRQMASGSPLRHLLLLNPSREGWPITQGSTDYYQDGHGIPPSQACEKKKIEKNAPYRK